jgi:ABC-type uncharacterized transport system permease subunit
MLDLLFWPALIGYGEAAVAYSSARFTRVATWGVRIGWLLQTALLAVQAARTDGFPWTTWAGSLNLFVWLVVGAYLFWGCRPRYRLLGLAVMPLAAVLFLVAGLGGGTESGAQPHYGNLFLTLHVGFVLAAFAGFTLAAALAGMYLLEERRLQRRSADILRLKLPSLVTLERVTSQAITVSLPLLTAGLAIGIVRALDHGESLDSVMLATIAAWLVYGVFVAVRPSGRTAAYVALIGFALVIVVRLVLAGTHF